MQNPFKKIFDHQEVPKMLKDKVLNDVDMIKLTLDIADLFVVKYPNTVGDILTGGKTRNTNKED